MSKEISDKGRIVGAVIMIKYRHYDKLVDIQNVLAKELKYFPDSRCCESSRIVSWTLGLEEVAGTYQGGWHAWNYDPVDNLWIDISFRQFHSKSPEVLIIPAKHRFLKACEKETALQIGMSLPKMDEIVPLLEHLATV